MSSQKEPRINADERGLKHRELTEKIIKIFYEVYNELGFGFLESVYESAMEIALREAGLSVARQLPVPVYFRGQRIGDFSADMLVESAVVLELKACRTFDPSHEAQLLNYLRATSFEVGLLLNFGPKPEFRRRAFDNARKQIRVHPRLSAASSSSDPGVDFEEI